MDLLILQVLSEFLFCYHASGAKQETVCGYIQVYLGGLDKFRNFFGVSLFSILIDFVNFLESGLTPSFIFFRLLRLKS